MKLLLKNVKHAPNRWNLIWWRLY